MENASKALIMAAGILIGLLILALMVTLFTSAGNLSRSYEETRKETQTQQFNANFIKYVGKDLTIHEVLTLYNFAKENGFKDSNIGKPGNEFEKGFSTEQIKDDLKYIEEKKADLGLSSKYSRVEKIYKLEIQEYSPSNGHISKIKFSYYTTAEGKGKYKCYPKNKDEDILYIN